MRKPTNIVPILLGLLAIGIAGTGTAVAATGQLVNIVDPSTGAGAKVTSGGNLQVKATDGNGPMTVDGTVNAVVNGTVNAAIVREPFQQYVSGSSTSAETCEPIVVPAGKRLTIESFSAEAGGSPKPDVYLRMTINFQNGTTFFRRNVHVPLEPTQSVPYAGNVNTLLNTGATSENTNGLFSYDSCIYVTSGGNVSYSGAVSGWLSPL
jgi:hypothetical protein